MANQQLNKMYIVNRVGEVLTMNSGLKATIIKYTDVHNIDVEFENGMKVFYRHYSDFLKGKIKCPMIVENFGDYCKVINPNTKIKTNFTIDAEDLERVLENGFWFSTNHGYIMGKYNNKNILLHRFILNIYDKTIIDHIDNDKTNCKKSNLRFCTFAQNVQNQDKRKHNTSGYKGIIWNKLSKRWIAQIGINSNNIYIGCYSDKHEAARAYNEAALKYHGEFARLNVISEV